LSSSVVSLKHNKNDAIFSYPNDEDTNHKFRLNTEEVSCNHSLWISQERALRRGAVYDLGEYETAALSYWSNTLSKQSAAFKAE